LATNTKVEIESSLIHLGEILLGFSLLVMERDLKLWVELSLKTDSCNPLESFVKLLIIQVKQRDVLSLRVSRY